MAQTLIFRDGALLFEGGVLAMESDTCCCDGDGTPTAPVCGDCDWSWTAPAGPWVLILDNCIFGDCNCATPTSTPTASFAEETTQCVR